MPTQINWIQLVCNRARELKLVDDFAQECQLQEELILCDEKNRLDWERLYDFPDGSFIHDIQKIRRHLDQETGELRDCFWPRCGSRKES
ncbi:DUF6874 family protein [Nitrospina gracilis]|uniref:DUF6874 family protein n=1 Tax=Nitrospina gracilis TaxID=35801 RepID=UPI001F46C404|nr:hypothetical protein [Nitrospina gracilis]MCF8719241.1 hypothetical protein [Nitrospina gracilis Nb-211]